MPRHSGEKSNFCPGESPGKSHLPALQIWMALQHCCLCFSTAYRMDVGHMQLITIKWIAYIAKVYRQPFWLGLLGAGTAKRLIVWSNDRLISALDLGKLCAEKRNQLGGEKTTRSSASWCFSNCLYAHGVIWDMSNFKNIYGGPTLKTYPILFAHWNVAGSFHLLPRPGRYIDSHGQAKFTGTRALKKSQWFTCT